MYLTVDFLEKNKACEPGLKWFKKHYPNGVELLDFLDNCRSFLPNKKLLEFIYWGYTHLQYSEQELEKMKEVLCIDTSLSVWMSDNVYDSKDVARSSEVYQSHNIESSKDITRCQYVTISSEARDSHFLLDSDRVINSFFIVNSFDISDCSDIYRSDNCESSKHLYRSHYCKKSEGLIDSIRTSHSAFSSRLIDCQYCLFCDNLEDKKFHIFNQQVGAKDFFIWDALIRKFFQDAKFENYFITFTRENAYNGGHLLVAPAYSLFEKWSKEVFSELKKYPGYNDWFMYKLTMNQNAFESNN